MIAAEYKHTDIGARIAIVAISQGDFARMALPPDGGARHGNARFAYLDFVANNVDATLSNYLDRHVIYTQGDPADAVFYIASGSVKITVVSEHGKEGVISFLGPGDFFGEEPLDHPLRASTATTTSASGIVRLGKDTILRALAADAAFSRIFVKFLLDRNERLQADLVDHLFNSSEKRLARILLTLANGEAGEHSNVINIPVTQETLASMVGTTRSRINQFMTKFRKLGYIEYDSRITVHNSLLNIILESEAEGGGK